MRIRYTTTILTMALAALLAANSTVGQETGKQRRFWFGRKQAAAATAVSTFNFIDKDADGVIAPDEFYEHVKTYSFRYLDANEDGNVSRKEWLAVEAGPAGDALFQRWDKNSDGKLTLREFKETPKAEQTVDNLFTTLDANGDGKLQPAELQIEEEN